MCLCTSSSGKLPVVVGLLWVALPFRQRSKHVQHSAVLAQGSGSLPKRAPESSSRSSLLLPPAMLSHAVDQNSSLEFLCFVSASGAQLPVIVFLLLRVPLHPTRRCTTISKWHGPRREFASFCNLLAVPAFRLRSCLGFERLTQASCGSTTNCTSEAAHTGGSTAWLACVASGFVTQA